MPNRIAIAHSAANESSSLAHRPQDAGPCVTLTLRFTQFRRYGYWLSASGPNTMQGSIMQSHARLPTLPGDH